MKALVASIALTLAGCASTPDLPPGPVGLNETTRSDALLVTPTDVVEDSRCPINARCVWAGRVIVSAVIRGPEGTQSRLLILGEPIMVQGQSLMLASATPGRVAEAETPKGAYRFSFEP